jgi:hypothetical protein
MEVQNVSQPRRNRCSLCRQVGHNRGNCPHITVEATRLREAFNTEQRHERLVRQRLHQQQEHQTDTVTILHQPQEHQTDTEFRQSMYAQVVDMQRRLSALQTQSRPMIVPRSGPTVRERKIQEILFENSEMIPNGLYKELMDALVIRD